MGSFSWIHWVIVIGVAALLFGGRGKLSSLKGEDKVEDQPVATPLPKTEAKKEDVVT